MRVFLQKMLSVYLSRDDPNIDLDRVTYIIIGIGVGAKLLLWLWCRTIPNSLSAKTLAADHINDVIMNGCGAIFAISGYYAIKKWGRVKGGWIDPTGALSFLFFSVSLSLVRVTLLPRCFALLAVSLLPRLTTALLRCHLHFTLCHAALGTDMCVSHTTHTKMPACLLNCSAQVGNTSSYCPARWLRQSFCQL